MCTTHFFKHLEFAILQYFLWSGDLNFLKWQLDGRVKKKQSPLFVHKGCWEVLSTKSADSANTPACRGSADRQSWSWVGVHTSEWGCRHPGEVSDSWSFRRWQIPCCIPTLEKRKKQRFHYDKDRQQTAYVSHSNIKYFTKNYFP